MDRSKQMGHTDMTLNYKKDAPHANGHTNGRTEAEAGLTSSLKKLKVQTSDEGNLTREDVSLYYNFDGNFRALEGWLHKVVPIAAFASICHDTFIDIAEGVKVADDIDKVLDNLDCGGRRCIGLFGFYSITMPSRPHYEGTRFIRFLARLIAGVLDPHNTDMGNMLCDCLVMETGDSRRTLQDGTTEPIRDIVKIYCRDRLHERCPKIPKQVVENRTSAVYGKEPDQSYQPGYMARADNSTELPTVICEVGMSDSGGKVIFDCLTSLAGSRGKIDQALGVDLDINNLGLTGIRLFLFDSSITTLVEFAETNQSVARFTRDKVENRLIHLHYLRDHLHEEQRFEYYLHVEHMIGPTIEYYERTLRYLSRFGGAVTNEDVVEVCRVVLENAEVINLSWPDEGFIMTDINGQPRNSLGVKAEPFLGLLRVVDGQVVDQPRLVLGAQALRYIYRIVADSCAADNLEHVTSSVSLTLQRRHISDARYEEFVRLQGPNFDHQAFRHGEAVTVRNVVICHLKEDVIISLARRYVGRGIFNSRALRIAAAMFYLHHHRLSRVRVYDLRNWSPAEWDE